MKKILYFISFILLSGNIYFIFSCNDIISSHTKIEYNHDATREELKYCRKNTQKESKAYPYLIFFEQVQDLKLFYLKPKILEIKLYSEAGAFFKHIEQADKGIQSRIGCSGWNNDSKEIFYTLFKKNQILYKADNHKKVFDGINFFDSLCKNRDPNATNFRTLGSGHKPQIK